MYTDETYHSATSYSPTMNLDTAELQEIQTRLKDCPSNGHEFLKESTSNDQLVLEDDHRKRFLQYTLADAKFEDDYFKFYNAKESLSSEERQQIFNFYTKYISEKEISSDTLDLMPNISRFLFKSLPCKIACFIGAAGTGKTTASANMICKNTSMTACGATNAAYGAFTSMLNKNIKPGSYKNIMKETLHKLLNINCEDHAIKYMFDQLNSSDRLQNSYSALLKNTDLLEDLEKSQDAIEDHLRIELELLHPLTCYLVNKLKILFSKYWKHYRLNIDNSNHPFFQAESEVFDFIKYKDENYTSHEVCEEVKTIEGYKMFLQCLFNSNISQFRNTIHLPNILISSDCTLIEEAGRLPPYFITLYLSLWWCYNMTFNSPQIYLTIPTIAVSGSDSQSNVINFCCSMLDWVLSPAIIWNKQSMLLYRSDHNRRNTNSFLDLKSSMHSAACLSLEHFMFTELTLKSFMFSEVFQELVDDPRINPNAIRMYGTHKAVDNYINKIPTHGNADIEIWDCIFISSDVTLINSHDFDGIYEEGNISHLSEDDAERNRIRMWKQKKRLYMPDSGSCIVHDENHKERFTCPIPIKSDKGFNEQLEPVLFKMYEDLAKSSTLKNTTNKKLQNKFGSSMTNQQVSDIEYNNKVNTDLNNLAHGHDTCNTKQDIRFICGLAKNMLSHEEHKIKRMHGRGIGKELGKGYHLTTAYYSLAGAKGQTTRMEYDPAYDLCIEIADPDYSNIDIDDDKNKTLKESIRKTVNARLVYMCFRRKRYFTQNSHVIPGMSRTYFRYKGVKGIVEDIIISEAFNESHEAFKLLIYSGLLEDYKKWICTQYCSDIDIDILNMNHLDLQTLCDEIEIPNFEKQIISKSDQLISECCNRDLLTFKQKINDKLELDIPNTATEFKRIVLEIVNTSTDFKNREIEINIGNCRLSRSWHKLINKALYPKYQTSMDFHGENDIRILGPASNDDDDIWNKNAYRNTGDLIKESFMIGKKNKIQFIINDAIEKHFSDLTNKTRVKVLLKKHIIADTFSSLHHKHINLSDILMNDEKQSKYGQMLRLTPTNYASDETKLMHRIFGLNGGEGMNFPRPFDYHYCKQQSNIVLKTLDNKIYPYSKCVDIDKWNDIKKRHVESFTVLPLMNPLFNSSASTVDSMQGKTTHGQSMVDFKSMKSSKYLVACTRNDSSHNLFTSNVGMAIDEMKRKLLNIHSNKRRVKRLTSKYFYHR